MSATRTLLAFGLLVLAAPVFAADQATQTTRDERMEAALKDYTSGKAAMTARVPPPAPRNMKHNQSAKHP